MIDRQREQQAVAFPAVAVLGEVLWDVIGETRRLGGAPLNFAAHIRRLGHPVSLISALGTDRLGDDAAAEIARLDFDTSLLHRTSRFATGTAEVAFGADGEPRFAIARPAAYDALDLSMSDLELIRRKGPTFLYFGTLLAATDEGSRQLDRLMSGLEGICRFLDLNLRPGWDSPELITKLLARANVIKLNEDELGRVCALTGLPTRIEQFCRAAHERYGFSATAVTLGERGSAVFVNGEYAEAPGQPVPVADTVGAGDAFAAAFVHGLGRGWPPAEIAGFANRIAAEVVSRHGSLPASSPEASAAPESPEL